jgi:transcriptional regulator with XRE-family HTH domain
MTEGFPHLLRAHRIRRRWSQEQLGFEAGVSPRHLSCLETGKASPSRDMVLRLAKVLDLELRERNSLLVSAGFAAAYPSTGLDGPAMVPVSRAIELLLAQQEPYGAILIDRGWNVLRVNRGAQRLLAIRGECPRTSPPTWCARRSRPRGCGPTSSTSPKSRPWSAIASSARTMPTPSMRRGTSFSLSCAEIRRSPHCPQ